MKDVLQAMTEWLNTRPPAIKALAEQFPPGSAVTVNNEVFFIIGYTEGKEKSDLIVSKLNPVEDYEEAVATREYVCADCVKRMGLH